MPRGRLFTKTISILGCLFFIGVFTWLVFLGVYNLGLVGRAFQSRTITNVQDNFLSQTLMFCSVITMPFALAFLITMIVYLVRCFKDITLFKIYYKPTILGLFFLLFYIMCYLFILQFSLYYSEKDPKLYDDLIATTVLGVLLLLISIILSILVLSKNVNRFISYFLFLIVLAISSGILFYYKTMVDLEGELNTLITLAFISYSFPVLATFPILLNKKKCTLKSNMLP